MKMFSGLTVVACLMLGTLPAQACGVAHGGGCGGESFEDLDKNHDGVVSKKEFDAYHAARFKELDANHDGKLTPEEMGGEDGMAPCDMSLDERFEDADIDHDGTLSKDEAEIGMPALFEHFDEFDTNKDGKISKDELYARLKAAHEHAPAREGLEKMAPAPKK